MVYGCILFNSTFANNVHFLKSNIGVIICNVGKICKCGTGIDLMVGGVANDD